MRIDLPTNRTNKGNTMTKRDDGGAAFPVEADYVRGNSPGDPMQFEVDHQPGMTLRDYFAGQAIIGLISRVGHDGTEGQIVAALVAAVPAAFRIADKMIEARAEQC
jgi:hypothetical protein